MSDETESAAQLPPPTGNEEPLPQPPTIPGNEEPLPQPPTIPGNEEPLPHPPTIPGNEEPLPQPPTIPGNEETLPQPPTIPSSTTALPQPPRPPTPQSPPSGTASGLTKKRSSWKVAKSKAGIADVPEGSKKPLSTDAYEAWEELREELDKVYFMPSDDPDAVKNEVDMAEAVLAYEMMSSRERIGDAGKNTIAAVSPKLKIEDVAAEWQMLSDHKEQIMDVIKKLFRRPMFGKSSNKKVGYSSMRPSEKVTGIQEQRDLREVCFVPEGCHVSSWTVMTEVLGKMRWKLPKPNMMIKVDCGTRHSSSLSTPALIDMPGLQELKKTATASVHRRLGTALRGEAMARAVQKEIDDSLKATLVEGIMPGILESAKKSKSWIVVDRSNPTASSPTAELMLEESLRKAEAKPTTVVFDSLSRYLSFRPSRKVNMQLLLLGELLKDSANGDDTTEVTQIDDLYTADDFDRWEQYHVRDPLALHGENCDKKLIEEGDRRLPRKPEEVMIMTEDNGRKRYTEDGRPLITPQLKWLYHYHQYLFGQGTHYVIFENATFSSFSTKSNGVPWPEGKIFAHGGNLSFDRIQQSLSSATPTVMLYNTGGVTQTFGSLHTWCVGRKVMIDEECLRTGNDTTRAILERTEVVSKEPWTKRVGVSTVVKMQRLEKRAPENMRKTVAVIDALHESPEQVVEKVTACFACGARELVFPELGLGSAEEDVVLNAWQAHMVFTKNAKRFRIWGDLFYHFSLVLTFVSASLAVLVTEKAYTTDMTEGLGFDVSVFCNRLLLFIPIASSVVAAVISQKRLIQKWATMKTAASQIVAEIYKFRTDVLEYDPYAAAQLQNSGENGEQDAEVVFNPRDIFVRRYQEINKFALGCVGNDSLRLQQAAQLDLGDDRAKELFKQQLRRYVPREVLAGHKKQDGSITDVASELGGFLGRKNSSMKIAPNPAELDPEVGSLGNEQGQAKDDKGFLRIEPDDFVSPMTIETYIEYRSNQILKLCEDNRRPLAKRLKVCQNLVTFCGILGSLLSAVDKPRWIAVSVSFASVVMNLTQHEMLQQRLTSINGALRDLTNNKLLMDSLGIASKRTLDMKTLCVDTVETAMLEITTSWTGMSARPSVQVNEGKKE